MTILSNTALSNTRLRDCRDAPTLGGITSKHPLDDDGDENEKISKRSRPCCRRVPCKARGLSKSHNSDEAYFEIPEDAPHGLLLHCSHRECQASGRKFAYCRVCNLPVAKRNFAARHGHGLDIEFCTSVAPGASSLPRRLPSVYQEQQSPTVDNGNMIVHDNGCRPDEGIVRSSKLDLAQEQAEAVPTTTGSSIAPPALSEAETHWLDMLRPRPTLDDQVTKSFWMDQLVVDDSPLLLPLDQQQPGASSSNEAAVVSPRESYLSPSVSYNDGLSDDLDHDEKTPDFGENLYLDALFD